MRRSSGRRAAAAKTAAMRPRGLRRKGAEVASRPPAPDGRGCGPCISYALAHCAYLHSRRRSRPCRTRPNGPFTQPGFDQRSHTHATIINSLGATQLWLVAPSALSLVPSLSLAGHGHRLAGLPIALHDYSFRVEWSKLWGPGATLQLRSLV